MAVYEMLWDCAYCGTRKLLGKTHRFCPKCGAPQDPQRRYFPPDDEKVAVEGHEYVGADRQCAACGSAMSAKAAHCTQCGAPLDGSREVHRVQELVEQTVPPAAAKGAGCGWPLLVLLGIAGLALASLAVLLFWRRSVEARVSGHSWERTVMVEALTPKSDSAWCDEMPSDAYAVRRSREERSQRRVADGEECTTKRVDQGDGTFREEKECRPRFRDEPVYDERCHFTVDRWEQSRAVKAEGEGLAPAPAWPSVSLRQGSCRGCEREGGRKETLRVRFKSSEGKTFECAVPEARWRSFAVDSRWRLRVGVLSGAAACGSLEAAGR